MFKRIGMSLMGVAAAAAIWAYCPGLRTQLEREVQSRVGWNEEARRSDPAGFANHVTAKLKEDLDAMQKTRRELTAEVGQLVGKVREQEALRDQGRTLAEQVRAKFQQAKAQDRFPIEVRGQAYTEAEAKSQISMLLAETKGYEEAIAGLRDVKQRAEEKIETLAVKINSTEAQLVALAAKRGLIEAERLTAEGETLLAQVDSLMKGNEEVIEGNPVRTVRELLAANATEGKRPVSAEAVETFLAEVPAAPTTVRGQDPNEAASSSSAKPALGDESAAATEKPIAQPVKDERSQKKEKPRKTESRPKSQKIDLAGGTVSVNPAQQEVKVKFKASNEDPRPEPATSKPVKPIFQQF